MTELLIENTCKKIILKFPNSTLENDPKYSELVLTWNEAMKSDFLKTVLQNIDNDVIDDNVFTITIPPDLYREIRFIDIEHLINMWKGTEAYYGITNNKYIYSDIARLSQALLLSTTLPFVSSLDVAYPPPCQSVHKNTVYNISHNNILNT